MVSIKNNQWVIVGFLLLCALAVGVRAMSISQPYHQDEYKWAVAANPGDGIDSPIPHPPLGLFLYNHVGAAVGYDYLRVLPAVASMILLVLLFTLLWRLYDPWVGLAASAVYVAAFYATLGSIQIDIDGALLPLASLMTIGGYLLWQRDAQWRRMGLILLGAGIILGFLFKVSFAVVPIALCIDYFLREPRIVKFLWRKEFIVPLVIVVAVGVAALVLLWTHVQFLRYIDNFVALGGRDYFQLLFLTVKGVIYSSPLLIGALVLGWRYHKELSVWYITLALNVLFYYVVFDFSHRTFDRYLLFIVLPASVIAGVVLVRLLRAVGKEKYFAWSILFTAPILAAVTYAFFSVPHRIIPLIPKSAFINALISGHWSFLLPMTGGSGPAGFYVPVDALAFLWIVAGFALVGIFFNKSRSAALGVFIAVALVYNIFITNEFLRGTFYGSTPQVVAALIEQIDTRSSTTTLITYNDIAAWPLLERHIYAGRFYPHEAFVSGNVGKFAAHKGEYLVIGMPQINPTSGYGRFFAACKTLYSSTSGQITGRLLDCQNAPLSLLDDVST